MGKILSIITRPIKNYNVENRAHKVISMDKPIPAPKYESNIEHAEKLLKENPESMQKLLQKDTTLDSYLKDVYVKSFDPLEIQQESSKSLEKLLPLNRKIVEQPELGFLEPNKIPIGRCTLRQVLTFLTKHFEDPTHWNSSRIALDYNVPEDTIKNILKHFRIYKLYIPDPKSKVIIGEPGVAKKQFVTNPIDKLIAEKLKKKK